MQIQPYLFFEGRCEEAVAFYQQAIGAEVLMLLRFGEAPEHGMGAPENPDKVMHATLKIGDSVVMASDGRCTGKPGFAGISLSITAASPADAERVFNALGDGGQVFMPLAQTFFAERFGMLTDRFGVSWMITTGS